MSHWPIGTIATAASSNGEHLAFNAVDNNITTFWTDDTPNSFPANLSIITHESTPLTLAGIQVISSGDNYITAYDVYVFISGIWTKAASMSHINTTASNVSNWNAGTHLANSKGVISGVTGLMISVNAVNGSGPDLYAQINEVYPIYGGSSSPSSSPSMRKASIAGGTIGGIAAFIALVALGLFFYRRRSTKRPDRTRSILGDYNKDLETTGTSVELDKTTMPPKVLYPDGFKRLTLNLH